MYYHDYNITKYLLQVRVSYIDLTIDSLVVFLFYLYNTKPKNRFNYVIINFTITGLYYNFICKYSLVNIIAIELVT